MKGLISIYLLIILMISTVLILGTFEETFSMLTQIKFSISHQRKIANQQEILLGQLTDLDPTTSQRKFCVQNQSEKLCYLNNSLFDQGNQSDIIANLSNQNLLLDFANYERLSEKCVYSIPAQNQLEWNLVNPKTCLQIKSSLKPEAYYEFNLALEDFEISTKQLLLINGYTAINNLLVIKNATIISLGDLIIDNLILTEQAEINLISVRGKVHIRHYSEDAHLFQKTDSCWQIGSGYKRPSIPNLKFIETMAFSLTPKIPSN